MVAPGAKKPKGKLDAAGQAALQARREALVLVEEHFRDFDVVWAKVHGFPWWPGVLFHSWDVVRRAGIRTDPKLVATLVVPPPEKILVLDAVTGGETSAYRIRRYCLVMFLDKFNFSVVEIDPRNVASFTAHYQLYERAVMGKKKDPKKTDFRRAVLKATALLHMGEEHTEEDLVMLEEPTPAEKKRRLEVSIGDEEEVAVSLEDVWDDQEADEEAEFLPADECDDKAGKKVAVVTPKNRRKPQTASRSRSQKARMNTAADSKKPNIAAAAKKPILSTKRQSAKQSHVEEASAVDDSIAVVELVTPVKRRQKAPAKESKARVHDLSIAEKEKAMFEREQAELAAANSAPGRERALGKRQPRSVQQSQIRQNLMTGNLDPHTMVQCAAYRPKNYVEDPNNRSRGGPTLDPPFQVLVHPDVVFVADLHAHLATCEIIGFLGGKWDESANTL
ncbi:hypothetical protein BBO99_00006018 [Phytophthora kernoviae]|uniref:PWWP domain-containing protein n=2 Tax=Phytophthora kernoviae TaxID=325452 RepID=A0A3R7G522_9STRA|nr:hypothetical protein G195_003333 [Phytophthora kernoviae 00238/432]KAG2529307.1 hypothetical protein JM16_001847 [Phytophthora kernoviae]KAG2530415.1 hypothetical protein JM18_002272 [Phytophthora kernoviae]RLN27079.1 hypothetical protein BBI17_002525 [Phytophthora kernoviae]RLN78358.1 hypothetical protein BBO99_00006018 [Phytophthora kernoviae]